VLAGTVKFMVARTPSRTVVTGALTAYIVTLFAARLCGAIWATGLGTTAARLGYDALNPLEYPLTLLMIPLGAVLAASWAARRRLWIVRSASALVLVMLFAVVPLWTTHEVNRVQQGSGVWTYATPALLRAQPITSLRMRDGQDHARGAQLRLLAVQGDELVVYDVTNRRVSGFSEQELLLVATR
jgi:fumarate reductase subunit D